MENTTPNLQVKEKPKFKWTAAVFVGIALICFFLLIFIISVINRYTDTVEDKISDKARLYSMGTNEVVSDFLADYEAAAVYAAGRLKDKTTFDDFSATINALEKDNTIMHSPNDIRYIKDGVLYNWDGQINASSNFNALIEATKSGEKGTFGSVIDPAVKSLQTNVGMEVLAFYAPVDNNEFADTVVLFFIETALDQIPNIERKVSTVDTSEFVLLCSKEGRVVRMLYPRAGYTGAIKIEENANLGSTIDKYVQNTSAKNELLNLMQKSDAGAVTFNMDSEKYAMSISHNEVCDDYIVVSLYRASKLDSAETTAFASIGATLVILCLTIPALFVGIIMFKRRHDQQKKHEKNYDEKMGCPTLPGMEELIPKRIGSYPGSHFAVVGGRLKHYQYLKANYPQLAETMLLQVRRLLDMNLSIGEAVGLGNESEFVLLLHYRDTASLTTRLYKLSDYVTENIGNNQYNVHLDFGVFEIEKDCKEPPRQMIENAFTVIDSDTANSAITTVSVYNVIFRENYIKNAEVEVKMDYALQHDEFKVFFQPKINSETGAIDGCEALVRWLDAETGQYRAPGTFLPLFEQNGFIIKLDRYIFYKVCEFIGSRVEAHLPIFPTSVNVSRISAINSEFLNYYASVKKQFNVPDDFLTLELTESIATSSYEALNRMSVAFHKNHFLLSIDDYGSGYSSMNLLKNVLVDEIKMDRIFLDRGVSEKRDNVIMASIVTLANDLGIKVVQEGVETEEQLKVVQEAGCKIIQGYYYSKPLSIPEYIKFVDMKMDEENRRARQRTYKNLDDDDLPPETETDVKIV